MALLEPKRKQVQPVAESGTLEPPYLLLGAYDALLDRFVPPSLLVDANGEIVQTFGDASRFLLPNAGRNSRGIAETIHKDLRSLALAAFQRAVEDGVPSHYEAVPVRIEGVDEWVTIAAEALPRRDSEQRYVLLRLEPHVVEGEPEDRIRERLANFEEQLRSSRESLSATIQELEISNEELLTTNEELHSTNDELHSVNEELFSLNAEYQKKIQELLQLTNDMDNLLRSSDVGVVFLDTNLCIRKTTPATTASFYVGPQDIGRPIEQIASTLEHPTLMDDLRHVLESHEPIEREVRTSGRTWMLMRVLPYRTDTGAVEGVVLTLTDFTALHRAQQELRHSEANFHEMADFVNAIFWLTSPDGKTIKYVSPGYEKLWKRSLDSLCQSRGSWLDAVHPDDRESLLNSFATRNLEKEWEELYRIVWPDGSIRWIRDRRYPVCDPKGNVVRLAGISVDVTEMKTSQLQLEFTQFAVDNAGDMVFWANASGRILYANASAGRTLGYTRDTLQTMTLSQIDVQCPPDIWPDFVARLQSEGFATFESILHTRDGRDIPVEINATGLQMDDTFYCCSVIRDITERKHAERELSRYSTALERANEKLRQHNRELDEFAYLASHDLKEPLRAITTFADLLTQDVGENLSEDAIRDINFITGASDRMQRLITDLLALSRASRADMRSTKVDLRACALSALESLDVSLRETGAEIRIADHFPSLTGDTVMLTQLFQNLLSNALKFRSSQKPVIEITASQGAGAWTFGVHDNGIGIKTEYLSKVFQPFRRVHVQKGLEGSGIGLAICRKVIERHGGRIWVESRPNAGAHFMFTLGRRNSGPRHAR